MLIESREGLIESSLAPGFIATPVQCSDHADRTFHLVTWHRALTKSEYGRRRDVMSCISIDRLERAKRLLGSRPSRAVARLMRGRRLIDDRQGRQAQIDACLSNFLKEARMSGFKPLHDRVLVRRVEAEERTPAEIIIPDTAKEKPIEGEVLAVGQEPATRPAGSFPWMSKSGTACCSANGLARTSSSTAKSGSFLRKRTFWA